MGFKLKILSLVLGAMLAMGATGASAAEFHAAATPVEFTGTQTTNHVFKFKAGTVTCKKAAFAGTLAVTTATSLKLSPSYAECTFNGVNATVDVNGCTYAYTASSATSGQIAINCPEGKTLVFTGPSCTVTVAAQGPLNKMKYETTGTSPNRDFDIIHEVTEIKYTQSGAGCLGGSGTFTDGTYTGAATVKGENPTSKAFIEVWVA